MRTEDKSCLASHMAIERHQMQQFDHPLFIVRAIVRDWARADGYELYAFMPDGAYLCAECVRENYALIVKATLQGKGGYYSPDPQWCVVALASSEVTPPDICAHCYREIGIGATGSKAPLAPVWKG